MSPARNVGAKRRTIGEKNLNRHKKNRALALGFSFIFFSLREKFFRCVHHIFYCETEHFEQLFCWCRFTEGSHTDDATVEANVLVPEVSNTRFDSDTCSYV
ncbi:hypothetical protein VVS316_02316 [Vibrio vulnificus]|nr:hypothetical protein VVS316_02316 [Vibrio vulnificus]